MLPQGKTLSESNKRDIIIPSDPRTGEDTKHEGCTQLSCKASKIHPGQNYVLQKVSKVILFQSILKFVSYATEN